MSPMNDDRAALDPMVALLHEARCGPEVWKGNEHVPWSDDHHDWDVACVKALRLLGVTLRSEGLGLDALREAATELLAALRWNTSKTSTNEPATITVDERVEDWMARLARLTEPTP